MRNTADVRYMYTSWQTAYPGRAVDLTELDFPPVHYDAGVAAALRLLDLGAAPRAELVAEIRDDLRDALFAAEDLECAYAAVLYPEPRRSCEHVWVGFSVFDNRDEPVTPAEALAEEVLDPAKHEVVSERIKELDLPDGPAARLFQTTVTRDAAEASFQFVPRLTVCGVARQAGAGYVIRGHATSAALVDTLDRLVMAWARSVSFGVPVGVGAGAGAGAVALAGTGPQLAFHPGSTPLPPLG
ncbi:hypothetical protein ABH935_010076 [Catenulispora sp. GAS73]|uniref:hypothetical protein n=1 Tax=Catenulispora sp. GAS73 TaxID=3156269 RepID=UPI003516E8D6